MQDRRNKEAISCYTVSHNALMLTKKLDQTCFNFSLGPTKMTTQTPTDTTHENTLSKENPANQPLTSSTKYLLIGLVGLLIFAFFYFDLGSYLSFESLKASKEKFAEFYASNAGLTIAAFFLIYVLATALSLPGATILTLAGGALFGLGAGTVIVSFASTLGATLAFLGARFIFRDWVLQKLGDRLKPLNEGVEKEGAYYLFSLRLVPLFPFFMINLLMGLTPIKASKFFFVSQIGMLPGTLVYVNAGTQLSQLDSLSGILSPKLLAAFVLLGLFPLIAKKSLAFFKKDPSKANT